MCKNMVAIYARVSKKDRENGRCSESISHQISIARSWIKEHVGDDDSRILVFSDEGYTGTNLDRPAVSKLLAGIFLGKLSVVVFKDFSRLSRNHLQLSELLEMTFPRYPVRIVSISESYDSAKGSEPGLSIGIKSIYYEYYCRDVSRKVKHSLCARKESGYHAVSAVPYGYRKSAQTCNGVMPLSAAAGNGEWEICREEADNVKKIYEMAALGESCPQIAGAMQTMQNERKLHGDAGEAETVSFAPADVWRILNNPVYTGKQVWHKYESVYQNGFTVRSVPREHWRLCEGRHPAIISEELYHRVQDVRQHTAGYGKKKRRRHLFHGISKCIFCKAALCRSRTCRENLVCRCVPSREAGGMPIQVLWEACFRIFGTGIEGMQGRAEKEMFLKIFIDKVYAGNHEVILIAAKIQDKAGRTLASDGVSCRGE